MRHYALWIQFRGLLKRADRRAMIESLQKTQTLIEIALRFRRNGGDFAGIGAEPIVERFLRCIQVRAAQCQRRPDDDVKDFGGRFHQQSRQTIHLSTSGNR